MNRSAGRRAGFTLIEVMVVISILSILASVVLVSLNASRYRGSNARIQQETVDLRNQLEEGWNGSFYSDLISDVQGSAGSDVAVLDIVGGPYAVVNPNVRVLVSDILGLNGQTYGATEYNIGGCISYCVDSGYPGAGCQLHGPGNNGLTVFTFPPTAPGCAILVNAQKYAIYSAYLPGVGTSGYFCADSSGHTSNKTSGAIPIAPGPNTTCN